MLGPALLAVPPAPLSLTGNATGAQIEGAQSACNRAAFRVMLDVGHTAEAPGAISARGVGEYYFNLHLARVIEATLLEQGFTNTALLVTSGPAKKGLAARVARANASSADLFLSIHHDSVPQSFKENWEYEGQPYAYSDRFKGHSIFVSSRNSRPTASLKFARLLGRQLKQHGLQYTPHYAHTAMGRWQRQLVDAEAGVYRYDQLLVLRTTRMPAVLFEAGSIVNREEEILIASPDRQALIASSILHAVQQFCASRRPVKSKRHISSEAGGLRG